MWNYYRNVTSIEFEVVVYEPTEFNWFLTPVFEVDAVDQTVAVGSSLTYSPEFTIEHNGWILTLL